MTVLCQAFGKFEDSRKWFTIPAGAVRSSWSRGSSTSRSAFGKIFEANHPHQASFNLVPSSLGIMP